MTTDISLVLNADTSGATKSVAGFRKEYGRLVAEIETPLKQVDAFTRLQADLTGTQKAAGDARTKVRDLAGELARATTPTVKLQEAYKLSVKELEALERKEVAQVAQLERMGSALKAAGVNTRQLTSEQQRLRAALAAAVSQAASGSKVDNASDTLGITRARQLRAQLVALRDEYDALTRSGKLSASERAIAETQYQNALSKTRRELLQLQGINTPAGGGAGGAVAALGRGAALLAAAGGAMAAARAYAVTTDAGKKMEAQLKNATTSSEEFTRAQTELFRIAQDVAVPMESLTALYARLAPAMRQAGNSQGEILSVIEGVSLTLKISGASAAESSGAILQFSQALGAGVLRGDEFNSVIEQAPRLAQALADGLQVPIGALRGMAAEGKLTSDVIVKGLSGQLDKLRQEAGNFGGSISGAFAQLGNEAQQAVIDLDKATGASNGFVRTLGGIRDALSSWRNLEFFDVFRDTPKTLKGAENAIAQTQIKIAELQAAANDVGFGRKFDWSSLSYVDGTKLRAQLQQMQAHLARLEALRNQLNGGDRTAQQQRENDLKAHRERVNSVREQMVKDLEDNTAKVKEKFKKLNDDLKSLQTERESIEKEFNASIAKTRSGVTGTDTTFGGAMAAKQAAGKALKSGDGKLAVEQAKQALQILEQLEAAGSNTYGFAGIKEQLKQIALAGNSLQQEDLKNQIVGIGVSLNDLASQAEKLKAIQVSVVADGTLEQIKKQLGDLSKGITVPVTVKQVAASDVPQVNTAANVAGTDVPWSNGFDQGGYTGPGGKYQPAGIVHAGEYVQPQEALRHPDALGFMEAFRRRGMQAVYGWRGYADGGLVGARTVPRMSAVAASAPAAAGGDLGTVNMDLNGQTYSLQADRDTFGQLRNAARKHGNPRRRT